MITNFKRLSVTFALLSVLISQAFTGEFLVHDEIYTWDASALEGKRSWYFDNVGPSNWISPENYYNGQFYFRYEIVSQPTTRACKMQFVVWQDWNYPTSWLEQASPLSTLYGTGSVAYANSSPSTWWRHDGHSLDFSRPDDFYKFGVMVWSANPEGRIAKYLADRPEVDKYDEIWADRYDWFPLQVRFTIVAVSAGSTFSGWENYVSGGPPPPTDPTDPCDREHIDNSPAPSANAIEAENMTYDGYFTQALMGASNGAVAGLYNTGTLTGNEEGSIFTSFPHSSGIYDIKVVYLDENDGASNFILKLNDTPISTWTGVWQDCQNKYTTRTISDVTLYNGDIISIDGDHVDGAYAKVDYIDFTYKGEIVIEPPSFSIDYINEQTSELVISSHEYSYNQINWTIGDGSHLSLIPGQDVYFRYTGQSEGVQHLEVEDRPATPSFSINFSDEITEEIVNSVYQYSTSSNMSGAITGNGSYVDITPGQNLYFIRTATSSSFASEIQALNVPDSPEAPVISINYGNEKTNEVISNSVEYSVYANMSNPQTGTNQIINISPGTDLYFRYKATESSFASSIYFLDVPSRPATPSFTIDYLNETTNEVVSSSIEMSANSSFTSPQLGEDEKISVSPGESIYFRALPTTGAFISATFILSAPERPSLSSYSVNFYNRTTQQTIPAGVFYSENSDMSGAIEGTGSVVMVTPGTDLFLSKPATAGSFSSEIFHLDVPAVPEFSVENKIDDEISSLPITVNLTFDGSVTGFSLSDLFLTNATASNLQDGYTFNLHPLTRGNVSAFLPTNVVSEGNFQTEILSFNFTGDPTGLSFSKIELVQLFPNPSSGILNYVYNDRGAIHILIYDSKGRLLMNEKTGESEGVIDLQEFKNGNYIVKFINSEGKTDTHKIIFIR
ncbi:MAG: T9SS type A sorting domain-containing protein [Bacteroidales bacterium]|nr:T9SS type A sorting domain-containing protein [Bacteroidales bacterium]